MTLSSELVKVAYNGDGATTSFSVTFVFWDLDDVRVILTDASDAETVWTRGTQYTLAKTVTGSKASTGTLTVITTPTDYTPASGTTLTLISNLLDVQDTSLPAGGVFPSAAVEQRFDQLTRLLQQRTEELSRAPKYAESEAAASIGDMPTLSSRKSNFFAFDAAGKPVAAAGTSANLGPVTSFIDTLLDDPDATTARVTLGATFEDENNIIAAEVFT